MRLFPAINWALSAPSVRNAAKAVVFKRQKQTFMQRLFRGTSLKVVQLLLLEDIGRGIGHLHSACRSVTPIRTILLKIPAESSHGFLDQVRFIVALDLRLR